MALLETLTLQVGPAIAKAILKKWLKDSPIAEGTASSLVDIFKTKTADVIAQQRGRRQFEAIGERVAESLLPVFAIEGANLDEGSRNAVALAVAQVLDKSHIDPALLAEKDLEPTRLAQDLMASAPSATRDFSAAETALYQRILSECSQCIVDIASQLPNFNERTFSEVLKRENELLDVTNQLLEEVRRIRTSHPDVNREAARFETEYRRAVIRRLDELELFGVDVSTASRRHRLSVAYVTLSVQQEASMASDSAYGSLTDSVDTDEEDGEEDQRLVTVEEALGNTKRLLLLGHAGSGKTTLLQWMAVRSASQDFAEQLAGWNGTIPFFIRLRQCAESGLPTPKDFPGLIAPAIADTMSDRQWVHDQLQAGRALVLVDGVDEVPVLQRQDVHTWLKDLVETYPEARFIVTSRPHAVAEGWMQQEGFEEAELQPMDLASIHAFIDHWHAAVRQELHSEEEKAELELLARHLKEVIQRSRPIRNLATSPLLCAMLCALNRDRRQQLPSDRIELYEACCQMLMERRDIERRVDLRDYPQLSYRQKRVLLQDFAYYLLTNGWSEVPLPRADDRLTLRLAHMEGVKEITGADVRHLFVDRSGIIREPFAGHVDFTHRTFQEFLAAQAALDEGDLGVLVKNAHDDQWQEVIILAAGLASKKVRGELIQALITRGGQEPLRQHQLHLLAVACLETSLELDGKVKEAVQERLTALIPPKIIKEAKALASAGELAIPYLAQRAPMLGSAATASIRTLALIGGEAALNVIESYSQDRRQKVMSEILRAWDSFDRESYARRVLARVVARKTHLELGHVSSLEGIQCLTHLTSLTFHGRQVQDLSPLPSLANLTTLDLQGCGQVTDLGPLKALSKLRRLFVPQQMRTPEHTS
jgi:hypothetical protein